MQVSLLYSILLPATLFLLSSTYLVSLVLAAGRRERLERRERKELEDSVMESQEGPASQTSTLTLSEKNNR